LARLTTTEVNEDMKAAASLAVIAYIQARPGDHRQAVLTEGSSELTDGLLTDGLVHTARPHSPQSTGVSGSRRDVHRLVVKHSTHTRMCRVVNLPGVSGSVERSGRPSVGPADAFVS
jgi:hypothetical protein